MHILNLEPTFSCQSFVVYLEGEKRAKKRYDDTIVNHLALTLLQIRLCVCNFRTVLRL